MAEIIDVNIDSETPVPKGYNDARSTSSIWVDVEDIILISEISVNKCAIELTNGKSYKVNENITSLVSRVNNMASTVTAVVIYTSTETGRNHSLRKNSATVYLNPTEVVEIRQDSIDVSRIIVSTGKFYLSPETSSNLAQLLSVYSVAGITELTGDVTAGPGTGAQAATVRKIQGRSVSTSAPSLNDVLKWDGSQWAPAVGGGGSTTPGGSDTHVQFNDGGSTFGGDAGLTYNKTTDTLTGVVIKATNGISGSVTRLTDGRSYIAAGNNITVTSQSNGQVTVNAIPAGSDTQVQFNDGGSIFGGDSGLTYSKSTDTLNGVIIKATSGFSGSLTQLTNGTSYLTAGSGIVITSQSNGPVNVGSTIWEWNSQDVSQFDAANPVFNSGQSGSIAFGTGSLAVNKVSTSIDITGTWTGSGGAVAYRVATSEGLTLPERFRIRLGLGAIPSGIRIGFMFYDPGTWSAANLLGGALSFYSTANAIYPFSARGSAAGAPFAPFNFPGATPGFASQFPSDFGETLCEWDCVLIKGSGGNKPAIMLHGQSLSSYGTTTNASVTIDRGILIGSGNYNDAVNAVFNNATLTGLAVVAMSTALGTYTAKITRLQILKAI